jgi:hypothetical protein
MRTYYKEIRKRKSIGLFFKSELMKNTVTLHMNQPSGNLAGSLFAFLSFFMVVAVISFVLRIATLGFFKLNLNRKFLRKYILIYKGLLSYTRRA